jgi:ATP-binding cassette subfamily B protein
VVVVLLAGGIGVMNGRLTLGTFVAFDAYVLMLIFPMFDIGTFFVRGRQSAVSIERLLELEEPSPEIFDRPGAIPPAAPIAGHLRFESVSYAYARDGARSESPGAIASPPVAAARNVAVHEPLPDASPHELDRMALLSTRGSGSVGSRATGSLPAGEVTATPGAPRALSDISFEVRSGEIVAVVGAVGSGKSTLLRLVSRLTDPSSGRILLDESDLRDLPLGTVRSAVGYVPQEALLFSGTIRDNIRFGREGIVEKDVQAACEIARLGKELAILSAGLDTRVGVRGVSLSGGQKQRVALGRALVGRPRILVLDDVTAALDAETEASLWEELHRVLPDLATLVVTHRTATLERADRILVLDRGCLVEQGTHAHLSEEGTVYRSIYRRHILEERVTVESDTRASRAAEGEAQAETG